MEDDATARRSLPWPAHTMSSGLMLELGRVLQEQVEGRLAIFIRPENMLRFKHGHRWSIRRVDASEDTGDFKELQSLLPMSHEHVVGNNLGELVEAMYEQSEALAQQSVSLILERAEEAVEQTGNTVSFGDAGSFANGYLETLRRSKFFSDQQGQVTPPTLYTGEDLGAEIERRVAEQGPAFRLRVEEIMHEKAAEAVKEERERLSRYEGFDEDDDG